MIKADWDITDRPQTRLKLDILGKYLQAWAIIIGGHFREAYYIDCFAGRGKYHLNDQSDIVNGSPLIALDIAKRIQDAKKKKGKDFRMKITAIDSDSQNISELKGFMGALNVNSGVEIKYIESEFGTALPSIINETSGKPAFFFIDPYGVKGVTKESLDLIAARRGSTEILYNYMRMGVQRVAGHKDNIANQDEKIRARAIKTVSHLNELFGDTSWADKDEADKLRHFVEQVLGNNYKCVLNLNVPYPSRGGTLYNLLFATNYDVGEKIMKDIIQKKLFEGTLFEKCPFDIDLKLK